MIAEWHDGIDEGWYLQVTGGISTTVSRTEDGRFTFDLCGIPMPPGYVYDDVETAKADAAKALRRHLNFALERL